MVKCPESEFTAVSNDEKTAVLWQSGQREYNDSCGKSFNGCGKYYK